VQALQAQEAHQVQAHRAQAHRVQALVTFVLTVSPTIPLSPYQVTNANLLPQRATSMQRRYT